MRWLGLAVLGACGFQIAPGSQVTGDDGPRIDASVDPDAAIPPPPDAPIDAVIDAAIDAPPPTWVLVETLSVPCGGTVITSSTVLQSTGTYRLRASGTCVANTANGSRMDAEYVGYNVVSPPADVAQGVDIGLAVDDPTPGSIKQPRWGGYTSSHVYERPWSGTGATITARMHDAEYDNNSGSVSLEIYALQ